MESSPIVHSVRATPSGPVFADSGETDPPPEVTSKVTSIPRAGWPFASSTWTEGDDRQRLAEVPLLAVALSLLQRRGHLDHLERRLTELIRWATARIPAVPGPVAVASPVARSTSATPGCVLDQVTVTPDMARPLWSSTWACVLLLVADGVQRDRGRGDGHGRRAPQGARAASGHRRRRHTRRVRGGHRSRQGQGGRSGLRTVAKRALDCQPCGDYPSALHQFPFWIAS